MRDAEEIRCLKATIEVHLNTIRDQDRNIDDGHALAAAGETERRRLSNLLLLASAGRAELATEVAQIQEEVEEQADTIRERDGTIEGYRKDFRVMVERIEELTP
ncbi:hypothetical protein LCGC14_2800150 [marine sediment metagenome]|uniref:Uncharacterized protein n=1 Tax=marine sediment metagenome TaxID=412755 RepID=A0A0F9BEB2_9ZZZZ